MKTIDNRRLSQLRSIDELRSASRRIDRSIRRAERNMKDELTAAKEMFSWREGVSYAFDFLDSLQSLVRYVGRGVYSGFVGFTRGLRRRRRGGAGRA